jgi:hypothetical protein
VSLGMSIPNVLENGKGGERARLRCGLGASLFLLAPSVYRFKLVARHPLRRNFSLVSRGRKSAAGLRKRTVELEAHSWPMPRSIRNIFQEI